MTARGEWVVAIRLRQLGDVLAALDSVRALKEYRPERRTAYVVDSPFDQVLGGVGFIDRVLVPPRGGGVVAWARFLGEVRSLGAAAAVDFHGSARSALIALASGAALRAGYDVRGRGRAYTIREPRGEFSDGVRVPRNPLVWGGRLARHAGAAAPGALPPALSVDPALRAAARARLVAAGVEAAALDAGRLVGLNPGRPVPSKSWPSRRFAAVARAIAAAGARAVVLWGPGEEQVARAVAVEAGPGTMVAPAFALGEMTGVLANLAALVTSDSGLKHLAVCVRVPTVTVFGSTDPREWHMGGARDRFLWWGLSCSPCRRLDCPFGAPCLDIPEDAVVAALRAVLGGTA
ncbi:MAG TPA: glycosyltransferase family 9 protein [Candidatus Krumholzibacteria bacterium]|nr:glycosyltransferase family 9 protein [Candidatus Krumholzibacteria bacterium]